MFLIVTKKQYTYKTNLYNEFHNLNTNVLAYSHLEQRQLYISKVVEMFEKSLEFRMMNFSILFETLSISGTTCYQKLLLDENNLMITILYTIAIISYSMFSKEQYCFSFPIHLLGGEHFAFLNDLVNC